MRFISLRLFIAAVAIIMALGAVSSGNAMHSIFQTMDRNQDGKIGRDEFSADMIKFAFSKLDDNDSGSITKNEWDTIPLAADIDKHDELFKSVDTGKDRSISLEEFSAYAGTHSNVSGTFDSLDNNGDGILSPDEITVRPPFSMVTVRF